MMDCSSCRRPLMAQPYDPDPALREHLENCRDCDLFARELLQFESTLERALRVALPATGSWGAKPRSLMPRRGWLAMAASFLVAAVVAGGLWVIAPGRSLAADVVGHMSLEPQAWQLTAPVAEPALKEVLRNSHLRLAAAAGTVSYAASCTFRGHQVPHLVMQTASGPVTVMVLVHERAPKSVEFDEQGYRGVIVPVPGHGSLAVLTRGAGADMAAVERIAHGVLDSIVWTGAGTGS